MDQGSNRGFRTVQDDSATSEEPDSRKGARTACIRLQIASSFGNVRQIQPEL